MKIMARFLALMLGAAVTGLQAREFVDVTGRKMQGELVAHGGGSVEIKVGNATFGVPVERFSAPDQAYIRDWIARNPKATAYRIRLFAEVKAMPQQKTTRAGYVEDKLKTLPHEYNLVVYNQSKLDMPGAEIRYEIYINDLVEVQDGRYVNLAYGVKKADKLQTIPGKLAAKTIPAGGKVEFKHTFPIESYVDRDFGRVDQAAADKIIGVRVRVIVAGQVAGEAGEGEDDVRFAGVSWQDAKAEKETAPVK